MGPAQSLIGSRSPPERLNTQSRTGRWTVLGGRLPPYQTDGDMLVHYHFLSAGFAPPLGLKDMNLVDAAATTSRMPMPMLGVIRNHLRAAIAQQSEDVH